jgi:hypothetical protein
MKELLAIVADDREARLPRCAGERHRAGGTGRGATSATNCRKRLGGAERAEGRREFLAPDMGHRVWP